ncbi:MAG: hypothetical protein PHR03_07150 [Desulfovibrionales bacterium]|nr:hypothetical protein [Desulfovibrionales bacterium]
MNGIIKAHCNRCQGERNQEVLHSEEFSWEEKLDDGYPISGTDIYEMLKCCGCDSIILRHTEWFSGNMDSEGKLYPVFHFYPPAISRPEPAWLHELNTILDEEKEFIYDLMKEIYSSLHNNSRRVATMGIRALLEHIMINKAGDRGSFSKNIRRPRRRRINFTESRRTFENNSGSWPCHYSQSLFTHYRRPAYMYGHC